MYHFRYYAIGHSYLRHGPFAGWQMEGIWGMAASEPSRDYFHCFQSYLSEALDCKIEAVAENHATYERRCVMGATKEDYQSSPEYAHMQEVLENFKPNLISLFLGDGNVVAKDEVSLTVFFETLYEMVAKTRRSDSIVLCPIFRKKTFEVAAPIAERYGFLPVDVSFIHEKQGYENPYYAFNDYPEYDAERAKGAVEFRTHPSNLGHDAIAKAMLDAVREQIPERVPKGEFDEPYEFASYVGVEKLERFVIATKPQMFVKFHGFNVRQEGDCVTLGSAPETGASVAVDSVHILPSAQTFLIEMAVNGAKKGDLLHVTFTTSTGERAYVCEIPHDRMFRYEVDLSEISDKIHGVRVHPALEECVLTVRTMGFLE